MNYEISSPTIGAISDALSNAQAFIKTADKGSKGAHNATYATFEDMKAVAQETLSENGLSFSSITTMIDGTWVLIGLLSHSSGEWFKTYVPLLFDAGASGKLNGMQAFGSAQTYAQRYAYRALCGIAANDDLDDDGVSAGDPGPIHNYKSDKRISDNQKNAIILMRKQIKNPSFVESNTKMQNGKDLSELTMSEASRLIKSLNDQLDKEKADEANSN